jgi:hypothetical protein
MTPMKHTYRRRALGAAAVMLAAVVAACSSTPAGESSGPAAEDSTTTTTTEPDLQAYSACMRDNGVPGFPDPGPDGLSLAGTGLDPQSAEFQAAREACKDLMPPQGAGSGATGTPAESGWQRVVPAGGCACADGSEFAFWDRPADETKVVLYLEGGGSCTDAATCAFTGDGGENDYYDYNLSSERPGLGGGIFERDRADNPFADYSFVYVPLCTGDAYLGDATVDYSPELTVRHKGYVDGTAALSYLAEHYPDATQVVVLGKTAGSVAAPVYGGLVADLLPDARVTVLGAQSGHLPDDPDFNSAILADTWGAYGTMPDWEVNAGLTARDWGIPRFWTQAGLHDPDIVLARFDYAYDPNAARTLERMGVESSTLEVIDANEAAIESAGVVLHSFTAPGEAHGILDVDSFYEMEVGGVRLVDWIDALLAGEPLDDVHCVQCEG